MNFDTIEEDIVNLNKKTNPTWLILTEFAGAAGIDPVMYNVDCVFVKIVEKIAIS